MNKACTNQSTPHLMDYDEELVDMWTSRFLQEFDRPSSIPKRSRPKPHAVFGRTTYPKTAETDTLSELVRSRNAPSRTIANRLTVHTKLSDSRAYLTQKKRMILSKPAKGQESKFKGRQIHTFKIDLSKAKEKRMRQMLVCIELTIRNSPIWTHIFLIPNGFITCFNVSQYSREIASGKTLKGREIDSITRIVVQSFRKLITCERCALFLMDDSTNELYFKPIGDTEHSSARLKEIRFPASSGVAGWVASNKMILNIKNAYNDFRFNPEIDKVTGFRTRTILCHPVLSSSNALLGVIQMVNKKKGDAKELRDDAKKKKSGETNKGYQSCFEPFSQHDEETLEKCCRQVSISLEEIFSQKEKAGNEGKLNDPSKLTLDLGDNIALSNENSSNDKSQSIFDTRTSASNSESAQDEMSLETYQETTRRGSMDSMRRRSSLGALVQFVKRNSTTSEIDVSNQVLGEAIQQHRFRAPSNEDILKVQQLEVERRQSNPEYKIAHSKRQRMTEYHKEQRKG